MPRITTSAQLAFEVRKRIYCDLKTAVIDAQKIPAGVHGKPVSFIPKDWKAHVALSLQVDESTAFNPGVALNTFMHNGVVNFAGEYVGPSSASGLGSLAGAPTTATYGALAVPQSYSFGFGGTFSATATRIDKYDPTYLISELSKPMTERSGCNTYSNEDDINDPFSHQLEPKIKPASSSPLISDSDLGIKDWLIGAMFVNWMIPSQDKDRPNPEEAKKELADAKKEAAKKRADIETTRNELYNMGYHSDEVAQIMAGLAAASGTGSTSGVQTDTISLELKFIIVSSGNATPSWKLVRVTSNTGAPLFNVGRTRTHDLIITIGPSNLNTSNAHLASQIGAAVRGSNPGP
jgi:hypothetical protein